MSKKSRTEKYNEKIKNYIKYLANYNGKYKYIGKDKDGLYLYDYIPHYNAERNVFEILNEIYHSYIKNSEDNTNVEEDILVLFKDGEIITISEGIEKIETLINSPVDKLFKLLSEVQGVEIKPYDIFDTKTADNITLGTHYLDENFRRYYSNGIREYNEDTLRGILTGEMKILKCKKAVVLTEDDIICLKYYLKNGYKYITNYQVYKKSISTDVNNPIYIYGDFINDNRMFEPQDELSFVHHDHKDIWNIEELLEQERVSND